MSRVRGLPLAVAATVTLVGLSITSCTSTTQGAGTARADVGATPTLVTRAATTPTKRTVPTVPSTPTARTTGVANSGPVVVLNPGHNGGNGAHAAQIARLVPSGFGQSKACDTTGTTTNAGYPEHAFNWDVALRVRTLLQARGVRVVLTRPDDAGVGPCVDQRAATGNRPGVAAVVSIHADGAPTSDHGFHVCYASRPPAGAATQAKSVQLSTAIHDALLRGSGLVPAAYIGDGHGYFARSDLAGLNLATEPATFLEIGNMRNGGDAAQLSSVSGRARIAAAIAAGILDYLGR